MENLLDLVLTLVALLFVISVHESAHAYTAYLLGDPTAKLKGRISLNPLKHIDVTGLIMMFLIHIGWGKPVPVNAQYFKYPRRDEAITALAGPLSNILLAIVVAIPIKYFYAYIPFVAVDFLARILDVSIVLFAFNILPFPPLDGSKFIQVFVPKKFLLNYDKYLANGAIYFALFMLFDYFVLTKSFGVSILSLFISKVFVATKSLIFLGT